MDIQTHIQTLRSLAQKSAYSSLLDIEKIQLENSLKFLQKAESPSDLSQYFLPEDYKHTESFIQEKLTKVLSGLMSRYFARTEAQIVFDALKKKGQTVHNDHIAFRSLLGIGVLEKIFVHLGYDRMEPPLQFVAKHLDAYWYRHPNPEMPRIFISELQIEKLSLESQKIILSSLETAVNPKEPLNLVAGHCNSKEIYAYFTDYIFGKDGRNLSKMTGEDIANFLHTALWKKPTLDQFLALQKESEWASWAVYNDYYLNHFTVAVHHLTCFSDLSEFNTWLENDLHLTLNSSGPKSKTSPDGLLIQSSTVAKLIEGTFADNQMAKIPGSYVEFAYRKILPQYQSLFEKWIQENAIKLYQIPDEFRRDGFETENADKIFESTYLKQVQG